MFWLLEPAKLCLVVLLLPVFRTENVRHHSILKNKQTLASWILSKGFIRSLESPSPSFAWRDILTILESQ